MKLVIRRPAAGEATSLKEGQSLALMETEEPVGEKVRPQFEPKEPETDKAQPRLLEKDPATPAVKEISKRIGTRLHDFLRHAVSVMRWRVGASGHPNSVVNSRGLQWSDDGRVWKSVPGFLGMRLSIGIPYRRMGDGVRASVTGLVEAGKREPLGHELFREAWNQRNELQRSSLLIGISAAEVGFKEFISDLVPHAEWLALHAPTPPLAKMLTDYLPKLPVRYRIRDAAPFVPKGIADVLKKGVLLRNETAHSRGSVAHDTLEEILRAVRDLLYLLDLYAGQNWAWEEISHDTRELIVSEIEKGKQPGKR
jgi:hypothetical protein